MKQSMARWTVVGTGMILVLAAPAGAVPPPNWFDEPWANAAATTDDDAVPALPAIRSRRVADGPLAAGPFPSSNVTLLSWMDLPALITPGNGAVANANALAGYVSPIGREYAVVGIDNGTAFVEITNPVAPVLVGWVDDNTSLWSDVWVYGHYAYNGNENNTPAGTGNGLQVISMQFIDSGAVGLIRQVTEMGYRKTHSMGLDPISGFVYSAGSNIFNGGVVAFSLNPDPSDPHFAGAWSERYVHEGHFVTYTSGPYAGRQFGFLCCGGSGLRIVDITDKSNMFNLSTCPTTYPGLSYCHQAWLSPDKQYLYMNDELDGDPTTIMFDVSDLANPILLGRYGNGLTTPIDHNLYTLGNLIFQSNYTSGLRVFDATIPTSPVEVAWIDTFPEGDFDEFEGSWDNDPYLPSGNVIISDINRGLFVVDVNPPAANNLVITYPDGRPEQVAPDAPFPLTVHVLTSGSPVNPATVTLWVSIDGGLFSSIAMSDLGGGDFQANIPGANCLDPIQFFVEAENMLGTNFRDPQAPGSAYDALAYSSIAPTFTDTLEVDMGWTVGDVGDNAPLGVWTRVNPIPTGAAPGTDHTDDPGALCFVTGQSAACAESPGVNDVDGPPGVNGKTTLISPAIVVTNPEARVGYWRWYNNVAGAAPNTDIFPIDITRNNGMSWVNLETVGPTGPDTVGGWIFAQFRIADFVTVPATIKVRFVARDDLPGSVVEAGVDDFSIFTYVCASCGDGVQNQGEDLIDCGGPCDPCACLLAAECDDAVFCTGTETCDAFGECQPGTDPCDPQVCDPMTSLCVDCLIHADCNDSVGCTDDACLAGSCSYQPNDANCLDDGLYCNGPEFCDGVGGCLSLGDPCIGQPCLEATDSCGCLDNAQCNDSVLCSFDECLANSCEHAMRRYGDVNGDGFVNSDDALCELDTFAGVMNPASCDGAAFIYLDIAPCPSAGDPDNMGDGFGNTDDTLAVLDAFAGMPACPCLGAP